MTKEKAILSKLQFELKTTNVTLRCGLVVFSRAWLEVSAGKPVHTIPSISSGVNLVWSFCSTTYNGDDKHVSLFWICCDFAERPRVDRAYLLCCWFLNFISSQSMIVLKYALVLRLSGEHLFFTCLRVMDKVLDLPLYCLPGKNSRLFKSTHSKTVSTDECPCLVVILLSYNN